MLAFVNAWPAFAAESNAHRFQWGERDCILEIADWLDFACGLDIAAEWRGRYRDQTGAEALIEAAIGFVPMVCRELARHGLQETAEPGPGDVGIVLVRAQAQPLAAILMPSGRWRMRTFDGMAFLRDVTVVVAWRVPCLR